MKKLLLACAALLSVACGKSNVFYVDEQFSLEEWEDIRRAGSDWQIATKERLDFEPGPVYADKCSSRNEIIRANSQSEIVLREGEVADSAIGFRDRDGPADSRIVMIIDRVESNAASPEGTDKFRQLFRRIVRHELGHHLGAQHTDYAPGSIMYGGNAGQAPECIDSVSVDSYCNNKEDCDRSQMRGCPIP